MSRSFLLFGFILYSVFLSSLANASDIDLSAPMDKGGWKLIWSEEFDYTGFLRNGLMIRKVMYINGEITRLNIIHPAERRTLGSRMGY